MFYPILMPERMISHYRVVRKLGAGGMGEVLLAKDTRLERVVALKIMSAELAKEAKQRKRFQAEAKAASGLSHPNICVIHEVGEAEDGRPFLAMEYVEGQTLDALTRQRRLKIREILAIGIQVAEALAAAHERHLVHRDIKTANIILDRRGQAKVLDFGLAKHLPNANEIAPTTKLTGSGVLIGTPHYMSPEQVLGTELDGRSDIFSLGVVLYELIVGQRPFLGNTIGEIFDHILHQQPEPLGLENPLFTPALDEIVLKCLEKKPENRYPSAKALADDLARLRAEAERAAAVAAAKPRPADNAPHPVGPPPAPKLARPSPRRVAIATAGVLVVGVLVWAFSHPAKPAHSDTGADKNAVTAMPAGQKSVAVLPFDNFSAEKETDYLSDGLTEEITTALARVPGLRVAARNSAFSFKNRREDLRTVGKALGVRTLLEGSLKKVGDRLRVSAQLVNADDGLDLWAETYDRSMDDIIAMEEDIAARIANRFELQPRAVGAEGTPRRSPANPEAYELYLKGLHAWNKRTRPDLEEAAQLFREASDKDPTYAAAYAGLALTYAVIPDYSARPGNEYAPQARAAAERALALDPGCAEAHAVLGLVSVFAHQYQQAEQEYRKAIQLNPNYATAHQWYGMLLRWQNRMDEAGAEVHRAEDLDPLSPIIKINVIRWLVLCRHDQAALEEIERGLQITPHPFFHVGRALLLGHLGRCPEALAEAQIVRAAFTNNPTGLTVTASVYAQCGNTNAARSALRELEGWKQKGYTVAGEIATVHALLGENDLALDTLEEGLAHGEQIEDSLREPEFNTLRSLPRYRALLDKLGLKD